jgi:hypothetical protein
MTRALVVLLTALALPALGAAAPPTRPAAQPKTDVAPPAHPAPARRSVVEEKVVNPKHLSKRVARRLARAAAGEHKRVLISFGADWCVACALIEPVFEREENRALFRGWELVRVDVDALPEGPVLGIPFDTIPFFMKLDEAGHVVGTLLGSDVLEGRGRPQDVDAAFARFLGT